jgi:uncharacterized protein YfaS (alpha-2-macroglobulin family)
MRSPSALASLFAPLFVALFPRRAGRPSRTAAAALAVLALSVSCLSGARAPTVAPKGTLGLSTEGGLGEKRGPFAVVFASPRGATHDPSEVTIVFNRPVRPLDLAGEERTPPAKLAPAVPGRWAWVGSTALQFVPESRLPRATTFTIEVPAGTRALDGSALDKPFTQSFSTALPRIARAEAKGGGRDDLSPTSSLELRFNQPVADTEILRAITLRARPLGASKGPRPDAATIPFTVKRPDPKNGMLAVLAPSERLPLSSELLVRMDGSLRGVEGPLEAKTEQVERFTTYGPLRVSQLDCYRDMPNAKCSAEAGFSLSLSNDVKLGALKKAIRIEPPVKLRYPEWMRDEYPTRNVHLEGRFEPGKRYTVTVASGLVDRFGQKLGADAKLDFTTDDLWPTLELGVTGNVLEPSRSRAIPVATLNVESFELAMRRLGEDELLALEARDASPGRLTKLDELPAGSTRTTIRPGAAKNKLGSTDVDPAKILGGKDARGAFAVAAQFTERPGTPRARPSVRSAIVQVTDLGITAKLGTDGAFVWVTKLSTGAPVSGATVTVRRPGKATLGPFTTDARGVATVTGFAHAKSPERETAIVFVRAGDDSAYRRAVDAFPTYRFDVRYEDGDGPSATGLLFSDRGIYRPGDVVHMKAIARVESLTRGATTVTPSGKTLKVTVEGPDGEKVTSFDKVLSSFGTAAFDVAVPLAGRLGTYSVRAELDGEAFTEGFEVAEFQPNELSVDVEASKPSYVRGEEASFVVRGDYLFGAPMSNAPVDVSVTRNPTRVLPPGLDEGFVTDADDYLRELPDQPERSYELVRQSTKLDKKGALVQPVSLALPGQRGPELLVCEAEVHDLARATVSGTSSVIVHPADFYAAVRVPSGTFTKKGDTLSPELLVVDPKGAVKSGVAVRLDLVKRERAVAKRGAGQGGIGTDEEVADTVVASCQITSGPKAGSCPLAVPSVGTFFVVARAQDGRKNNVVSAVEVYSLGAGFASFGDGDDLEVELEPDRKSYEPGQTARILVKSPFKEAEAWITVERAGVLREERRTLRGATPTIEIPITDELRPNAYVSVVLVRGRSKAAPEKLDVPDVGAPTFRMGYAELSLSPEKRRLKVGVTPSKREAGPGEQVSVEVAVRDATGKPARAEVTLYAVDEGVLALAGYQTPDPLARLHSPRALRVKTLESRQALARIVGPAGAIGLDKGRDGGGGGGSDLRRDFRAAAFYAPSLVTDDKGVARASFKLPDGLTTYRVMAVVAGEDDRFGFGVDRIVTSRPLLARPAFPRFVRAGDAFEAGVVVTAKVVPGAPKPTGPVEVRAEAEGLTIDGANVRSLDLAPGESREVRFAYRAETVGKSKLRFFVSRGADKDSVEIVRDVRAPTVLEAVSLYGETDGEVAEKLGNLGGIRGDVGGLELRLASTALAGLDGAMEQLLDYPYGCTEQLSSKLVPMVALRELAADFGVKLPADVDKRAREAVASIVSHQHGGGGFGAWSDSPDDNPWVSAYALWALHEAKKRGHAVPASALEAGTLYLREALGRADQRSLAVSPFLLEVLAELGAPDPGRAAKLFEQRAGLPLFARAQLLRAMALGKGDPKSVATLALELEKALRIDGAFARAVTNQGDAYAVFMDSDTRTSALVLRALLAVHPEHPLASKLALGLLADRRGGGWRTTQENAFALLALGEYRKKAEAVSPDFVARVFLGETELAHKPMVGRSLARIDSSIPSRDLLATLAKGGERAGVLGFSAEGQGTLFYEARLRYARKEPPRDALERGFFVSRTLRPVTTDGLADALKIVPLRGVTTFRAGDLVLADVVVVTPSPRHFVVIDEPLPAGLQAIDARLATVGSGYDLEAAAARAEVASDDPDDPNDDDDDRAMGRRFDPSWFVRELRDDRVLFFVDRMAAGMYRYRYLARAVTPGKFSMPPTKSEEMYQPEVFGRTAADVITITPP